jgi:hypothetical protein
LRGRIGGETGRGIAEGGGGKEVEGPLLVMSKSSATPFALSCETCMGRSGCLGPSKLVSLATKPLLSLRVIKGLPLGDPPPASVAAVPTLPLGIDGRGIRDPAELLRPPSDDALVELLLLLTV